MMQKTNRIKIKSGIPGLDEVSGGGIPKNSLTLLTGTTGSGKTIMSTQFIYEGAYKHGEKGVYVSLEEPIENIKESAKLFGWDVEKLESENKISFVRYDPSHIGDIYSLLENSIRKIGAQRAVIDSISTLGLYVRDPTELRRVIFNISVILRKLGCTAIMTSELHPNQNELSRFGVEEFTVDNVVVLYYLRAGSQFYRTLTVWKMRGTEHSQKLHPYKITNKGAVVYSKYSTRI